MGLKSFVTPSSKQNIQKLQFCGVVKNFVLGVSFKNPIHQVMVSYCLNASCLNANCSNINCSNANCSNTNCSNVQWAYSWKLEWLEINRMHIHWKNHTMQFAWKKKSVGFFRNPFLSLFKRREVKFRLTSITFERLMKIALCWMCMIFLFLKGLCWLAPK